MPVLLDDNVIGLTDNARVIDLFGGSVPQVTGRKGWELPPGYPVEIVEGALDH